MFALPRRLFALAPMLAACLFLAACEDTRKNIREGELLFQNERFPQAIESFERAIEEHPDATATVAEAEEFIRQTYQTWSQELFQRESYDEAARISQEFMDRFPDNAEIAERATVVRQKSLVGHAKVLAEFRHPWEAMKVAKDIIANAPGTSFAEEAAKLLDSLGHIEFEATRGDQSGLWRVNLDGTGLAFQLAGQDIAIDEDRSHALVVRPAGDDPFTGTLTLVTLETGAEEEIFGSDVTCCPHWRPGGESYHITKLASTNLFQVLGFDGTKDTFYNNAFVEGGAPLIDALGPTSPDKALMIGYQLPADGRSEHRMIALSPKLEWYKDPLTLPGPFRQFLFGDPLLYIVTDKAIYQRDWKTLTAPRPFLGEGTGLRYAGLAFAPNGETPALLAYPKQGGAMGIYIADRDEEFAPIPGLPQDLSLRPGAFHWRPGHLDE